MNSVNTVNSVQAVYIAVLSPSPMVFCQLKRSQFMWEKVNLLIELKWINSSVKNFATNQEIADFWADSLLFCSFQDLSSQHHGKTKNKILPDWKKKRSSISLISLTSSGIHFLICKCFKEQTWHQLQWWREPFHQKIKFNFLGHYRLKNSWMLMYLSFGI